MQPKNTLLPKTLVRQTWLHYFNDYLRERNIITDEEWRKMRYLIDRGTDKKGA